jgi:FkbH-like protein
MDADDEVNILCCSVRDRFADEGIVGVVILRKQRQACLIDSFLLSCRVLGRGVEGALLWAACQRAAAWGGQHILGEYQCSEKNGQTAQFFQEQGFALVQENLTSSLWTLPLPAPRNMTPNLITLTLR